MAGIVSEAPNFGIVMCIPPGAVELRELMGQGLTYRQKLLVLRSIAVAVDHCHSHSRSVSWLNSRSVYVRIRLFRPVVLWVAASDPSRV